MTSSNRKFEPFQPHEPVVLPRPLETGEFYCHLCRQFFPESESKAHHEEEAKRAHQGYLPK
jgi:hypothetical protein